MIDLDETVDEAEVTTGGSDPYCHFLDDAGRALCFADITGRRVHTLMKRGLGIQISGAILLSCETCGRPRCPKCAEIDGILNRNAA